MSRKEENKKKTKKADKDRSTVRVMLQGELREKFLYLKKKYGTKNSKAMVALLIAEKYADLKEKENLKKLAAKLGRGDETADEISENLSQSIFDAVVELRNGVTDEPLGYYVMTHDKVDQALQALKSPTLQRFWTSQHIKFVPQKDKRFIILEVQTPKKKQKNTDPQGSDIFETAKKLEIMATTAKKLERHRNNPLF